MGGFQLEFVSISRAINLSALISGKFVLKKSFTEFLSSLNAVISTNESTEFITGLVIYNPTYTYKFQLKITMATLILCSIWKVLAGLSVLEITILLNCIQCFRVHKKCFLSRLRPEKAWTAVLNIYNLLTTILTP